MEQVPGDVLGRCPERDQRPRRLAMQTLSLGRRQAISDRDRDQGMGDAVAVGIQEAGGGQRVAGRPELVERDRRDLGDRVRRSAVADHGARRRDRSVARLELGQAPAHDGARGRADLRPACLDLVRQLAEQPGVARRSRRGARCTP